MTLTVHLVCVFNAKSGGFNHSVLIMTTFGGYLCQHQLDCIRSISNEKHRERRSSVDGDPVTSVQLQRLSWGYKLKKKFKCREINVEPAAATSYEFVIHRTLKGFSIFTILLSVKHKCFLSLYVCDYLTWELGQASLKHFLFLVLLQRMSHQSHQIVPAESVVAEEDVCE